MKLGNCYQDAFNLMLERNSTLCHGRPVNSRTRRRYVHAWTEEVHDGQIFVRDPQLPERLIPWTHYYTIGRIIVTEVNRYSRRRAIRMALEFEHYGPWRKNHVQHVPTRR